MKRIVLIKALCYILCIAALCANLTSCSCICLPSENKGIIQNLKYSINGKKDAVTSKNFTVTGAMLSYYFYQNYSDFLNQYGTMSSYLGLDISMSLKDQSAMDSSGQTWFEYFMDPTLEQIKVMLVYCESAKEDGIQLYSHELNNIDNAIDAIIDSAEEYGYSTSSYISSLYGLGVSTDDIKAAMELEALCQKYISIKKEELGGAFKYMYDYAEIKYPITYNYEVINNIDA